MISVGLVALIVGCAVNSNYYKQENQRLIQENINLRRENDTLKIDLARQSVLSEDLFRQFQERQAKYKETPPQTTSQLPAELLPHLPPNIIKVIEGVGAHLIWREGNPAVVGSGIFLPRRAELTIAGAKIINQIVKVIKKEFPPGSLRVDGYTDNHPMKKTTEFKSNKELALARAEMVNSHLISQCSFSPQQITSQDIEEVNPIADNHTPEGGEKNPTSKGRPIIKNTTLRVFSLTSLWSESEKCIQDCFNNINLYPLQIQFFIKAI